MKPEPPYTVRSTLLKAVGRSPAHAKAFIDGGMNDETLSKRLGLGGHALLFGTPEVVIYRGGTLKTEKIKKPRKKAGEEEQPESAAPSVARIVSHDPLIIEVTTDGASLDGREFTKKDYSDTRSGSLWEHFEIAHEGKVLLNQTEYDRAAGMVRAVQHHREADSLIFAPGTRHEHYAEWLLGGRRCSGRFDAFGAHHITDLKCVADASPAAFRWQARKYGWVMQLAWYCDGAELAGFGEREPRIVAVESAPPHNVVVYRLTRDDLEIGREQYNRYFDLLIKCEAEDYWPGYDDGVVDLNISGFASEPDDEADDNVSGDDIAA